MWNEWGTEQKKRISYNEEKKNSENKLRKQQQHRDWNEDLPGKEDGQNFAAWQKTEVRQPAENSVSIQLWWDLENLNQDYSDWEKKYKE